MATSRPTEGAASVWPFSREGRRISREIREEREELLAKAVRKSEVVLVCQPNTWNFIVSQTKDGARKKHFDLVTLPGIDNDEAGRTRATVSGRMLAAIVDQMSDDALLRRGSVDQAMAAHIRDAIVLDLNDPDSHVIIIDPIPKD